MSDSWMSESEDEAGPADDEAGPANRPMSNMTFVLRCGAGKAAHVNNVGLLPRFSQKLMIIPR